MATFLEDMAAYLGGHGFDGISIEDMPDQPQACIALLLRAHTVDLINYGYGTRQVRIQVRAETGAQAYATACAMVPHLDSGIDENAVKLMPQREVIARPQTLPCRLREEGITEPIYYFDVSLFGENTP